MFCTHCGKPIDEGMSFCTNCGAPVEPSTAVPEQEAPAGELGVEAESTPEPAAVSSPETSIAPSAAPEPTVNPVPDPAAQLEQDLETSILTETWETEFQPTQAIPQPAVPQESQGSQFATLDQTSFSTPATQTAGQSKPARKGTKIALVVAGVVVLIAAIAAVVIFVVKPSFLFGTPTTAASSGSAHVESKATTDASTDKSDDAKSSTKSSTSAATNAATDASNKTDKKREPVTTKPLDTSSSKAQEESKSSSEQDFSKASQGSYILPDSATHKYTSSELSAYSNWELYLARNEIYARHGRLFKNRDLQEYFNSQSWYNGTISPDNFNDSVLNSTEAANVDTIRSVEQSRGSSYIK